MGQSTRPVKVQSLRNQGLIADQCIVANRFWGRLKGLIGTSRLAPGEGLLLSPCNDIHMWMMSMPIDVVFVRAVSETEKAGAEATATHVVCSTHENLKPWKPLPVRDKRARETLELPVGTIRRCEIIAGDKLCIS
jgi:uncharacterized membrane protein (UPF0127 family)